MLILSAMDESVWSYDHCFLPFPFRLQDLTDRDLEKQEREKSLNSLEAFVFETQVQLVVLHLLFCSSTNAYGMSDESAVILIMHLIEDLQNCFPVLLYPDLNSL